MKKTFLILLLTLILSCKKETNHQYPRVIVPTQKNVVEVNSKQMLSNNFDLYKRYFPTNIQEDVKVDYDSMFIKPRMNYKFLDEKDKKKLHKYAIKIIVDTSYTIPAKGFEYIYYKIPNRKECVIDGLINGETPNEIQNKQSEKIIEKYYNNKYRLWDDYINSLPILLKNEEKQNIYLRYIEMIQEAKDIDGIWKPIEYSDFRRSCTEGPFFEFYKNCYNIYPIIKYHGNFKTKLRVKFKIDDQFYYSNEFYGYINREQFNLNYLKEYLHYLHPDLDSEYYKKLINCYLLKS